MDRIMLLVFKKVCIKLIVTVSIAHQRIDVFFQFQASADLFQIMDCKMLNTFYLARKM